MISGKGTERNHNAYDEVQPIRLMPSLHLQVAFYNELHL